MIKDITGGRISVLTQMVLEINDGLSLDSKWDVF